MTDLVPEAVHDLLAYYTKHHPEARFGDLDITVLKRAVESIDAAAKVLLDAEEAVVQAREQFRGIEADLSLKAGRTLSFLKIYVDGDEEQLAKLEAISAAMPAARRKSKGSSEAASGKDEPKKRRGRKSKKSAEAGGETNSDTEQAIEAALEKVGLSGDEPGELGEDELEPLPAPAKKKHGPKSAGGE
jgi:hypothetical protein